MPMKSGRILAVFLAFSAVGFAQPEPFDAVPVGGFPADWKQWANDGRTAFTVSATGAKSVPNWLVYGPTSASTGRAWRNKPLPADGVVSADVFLNNPADTVVFARGAGLDGA
ncbi:MAG: hypothetical protein ACRC7O_19320, partial [Fimbriiglobus sp.]